MAHSSTLSRLFGIAAIILSPLVAAQGNATILNVSYDVSRELYKDINAAFVPAWQKKGGGALNINQSHGGSSKQAGAVVGGLEADVVTMNQAPDIDILVKSNLVAADWRKKFANDAAPYTTITVFLVRKGNPKAIKDWNDLVRPGLQVVIPNPKTSGNGRYTYLAAWGYALQKGSSEAQAKDFVAKLFANVPVFDGGGRGATTTFTQRGVGDALVTFENEAILLAREIGGDQFDVVYPPLSVEAAAPVAVVDKVVDKRGTRKVAEAYLGFLFSPEGQEIIAKHHFRPRLAEVFKRFEKQFPAVKTFCVEAALGGWEKVRQQHFADGALLDQISVRR